MKRFAVTLIIAVLALACAFAATSKNSTSGDKFVVTTTIQTIYPIYQIVGGGLDDALETWKEVTSSKTGPEVEGVVTDDQLSVAVSLEHFGKANNDTSSEGYVAIRYKNDIEVTIKAGKLINQTKGDGHVAESDAPENTAFIATGKEANFYAEGVTTTGSDTVVIKCHYTNGKKVAEGIKTPKDIAIGGFTWDISELTAGDTYKADVVVTYTVV